MLYIFTWDSSYLINKEISNWKKIFIKKHNEMNLFHIKEINDIDMDFLSSLLEWSSLFGWIKLVIIDLLDFSENIFSNYLENNYKNIWENNILVLNSKNFDKKSNIYNIVKQNWKIMEFNLWKDLVSLIKKSYSNQISNQAINTIIKYKWENIEKIFNEIEKLSILYDFIEEKHIIDNIIPEFEESIFTFINYLLDLNIKKNIELLNIILNQTNIYQLYNSLLSNIRVLVYIFLLKEKKVNNTLINSYLELWNRSFLINKFYNIKFQELKNFYLWLISLDKKMKTWKLLWSGYDLWNLDEIFKSEIEKLIFKISI